MKREKIVFLLIACLFAPLYVTAETGLDCQPVSSKRRMPGQSAKQVCTPKTDAAAVAVPGVEGSADVSPQQNAPGQIPQSRPVVKPQLYNQPYNQRQYTERPASRLQRPGLEAYQDDIPMPDRWRIVDALGYEEHWYDPYNRNVLKADKPVFNTSDWFFNLGIIADTVFEDRKVPTPVGASSTANPGQNDVLGNSAQSAFNQNIAVELVYYKGDTTFRPPDWEFRLTPVFNYNYVELEELQGVNANPREGKTRNDNHMGLQSAFVDYHIHDVSVNYDFDSVRVGIQPFNADFRGFLFQDSPFGVRLFGIRKSNVFQYNVAWFRKLEKDTNSGLNDQGKALREDDIFTANLYWQDLFKQGFFSEFSILHNRNREDEAHYDDNDFIVRPASIGKEKLRDYDVTYFGYATDGHIDRINLTAVGYLALGEEEGSLFRDENTAINAWFAAAEASIDFDWVRLRGSLLHASGDKDSFDDEANGFDAVFENPQFAGADTSYWIRQGLPLINGGRVALSQRNGVLASLRSSKDEGQSNFTNPGIDLLGAGVDLDVLPELRLSANWNYIRFVETDLLEFVRNQANIDAEVGNDVSISVTYRPLLNQNIVLRASYAVLFSGSGYDALYKDEDPHYFLLNALFSY